MGVQERTTCFNFWSGGLGCSPEEGLPGSLLTVPDRPRIVWSRGADGEDGKKWTEIRAKKDRRERRNTKGKRTPLRAQEPWDK